MRLPIAELPALSRRTVAVAAVAIVAAAVALVFIRGGEGREAAAEEPGVPTTPLERRDLVARESVDGTLGYAGEAEVINRLAGTITWLPAEGDLISRGRRLYEVDGEPVLLMYGDVPAYRDLSEGVGDGPDVRQLESNLAELGFDPSTVDEEFTSSTSSAVADWQESLDLDETGRVELGRVVFMAGARRVTSLEVSLGSDAGSGSGADPSATASTSTAPAETILASYATPDDGSGGSGEDGESDDGAKKPPAGKKQPKKPAEKPSGQGDEAEQPAAQPSESAAPQTSTEEETGTGSGAETNPSTPVITTSSERRIVTVELDPSDVSLAKRGRPAQVALPDGKEVKGRIASVATVAQAAESAEGESTEETTIEVTISLAEGAKVPGLDQAPVTVELSDEIRRDVFAVPVEALLGTAGDEYAIVVRDAGGSRQVPVTPGLFTDGYVEVEGDGLEEGAEVEVPGE